ncbi:PIG-L family deacetylase [Candidatus Woesearchaeota archaeon]|nr:PIG-L family deacetylase [Candidatus Woesearchaeota archaeon]
MALLEELLDTNSRLLIVGAHNDDVELHCGRLILAREGKNVDIIFTATGSIEHWVTRIAHSVYRRTGDTSSVRKSESIKALSMLGVSTSSDDAVSNHVRFLPYPQSAIHLHPECVDDLINDIEELKPDKILVQAYEGGHVDHDTTNFFVALAVRRLGIQKDRIVEYSCYNRYQGKRRVQVFVPSGSLGEFTLIPSPELQLRWLEAMESFKSQPGIFTSIVPHSTHEIFRHLPDYDYSKTAVPLGYVKLRRFFQWLPINIGVFLPVSGRIGYDELKWSVAVNPLNVVQSYKSILGNE